MGVCRRGVGEREFEGVGFHDVLGGDRGLVVDLAEIREGGLRWGGQLGEGQAQVVLAGGGGEGGGRVHY